MYQIHNWKTSFVFKIKRLKLTKFINLKIINEEKKRIEKELREELRKGWERVEEELGNGWGKVEEGIS